MNVWKFGVTHSDQDLMLNDNIVYAFGGSMPTYLKNDIGKIKKGDIVFIAKSMEKGIIKIGITTSNSIFCNADKISEQEFIDKGISKSGDNSIIEEFTKRNTKDVVYSKVNWLNIDPQKVKVKFNNQYGFTIVNDNDGIIKYVKSSNRMDNYISLLKSNKNLILTGAPGTGKTYLAKQIAESMNAETEFVQFHPSYDYTDFVEGLRPVKKDGGELGFELKDGIFKAFCKKALKNFTDSEKEEEDFKREAVVSNNITDFLDKCINDGDELELTTGNKFTISEYDETHIKVKVPNNAITSELTLPFHELFQLLLEEQKLNKVKDVRDFFKRSHNRQSDSYIFTLYNNSNLKKELTSNPEAKQPERKDYVFIIDEINRGEVSKIFGELFFSIDPGYRGTKGKVKTQYANLQDEGDVFADGFYIPDNVYIIGTMNDIDRSVESMDFAMRRRFTWIEITAEQSAENMNLPQDIKDRMLNLNNKIKEIPELGSAYCIGSAYFLKLENYQKEINPFDSLWNNHLKGVVFEYLRGTQDSKGLMTELENVYNNK